MRPLLLVLALLLFGGTAHAQYTPSAGKNAPKDVVERSYRDRDGVVRTERLEVAPARDSYGNAQGNQHDLAIDGAFDGQTVAVIQLYTIDFDFHLPKAALKEKGFSVYRWVNKPPSPAELEAGLAKASQLWVIAGDQQLLTPEHVAVIKRYFEAGHGVYIWGDNQPYYADANVLAEALFGARMEGDLFGDQTVAVQNKPGTTGLLPNHLLTTGLEHIYEGITIATIQPSAALQPLIYGSAGNLVVAYHDRDGRRAILDGGFTRLYNKWDTAGTARYVKNAASWLANAERFGDAVLSPTLRGSTTAKAGRPPATPAAVAPENRRHGEGEWLPTNRIGWILVGSMLVLLVLGMRARVEG
ncbi:MAG: hypothetical protein JNL83_27965 [Myxococcales bacterium]|nr:hypothetical protein [Myxococcales bacterium]